MTLIIQIYTDYKKYELYNMEKQLENQCKSV